MKLEIGFGSCPQTVELPDENVLDVLYPEGISAPGDSAQEVARALSRPIGTPPLRELARGKRKIAIVTSDITRPMPSRDVLPAVLEELCQAGVAATAGRRRRKKSAWWEKACTARLPAPIPWTLISCTWAPRPGERR